MLKRMLLLLGAVSLSATLLAGCASTTPPQATNAPDAKTAATSNVLSIGVDDSYPPMEFKDETGKNTIGFDMDVGKELAKRMGKTDVKYVPINFDGIFDGLNTKKYDIIISSISINPERQKNFSLTKPYIANKQVIVTSPANKTIKSLEDLAGKNVCAQSGTTSNDIIEGLITKGTKINYRKYDTVMQALDEVSLNRADAALIDKVVAMYYVKKDPSKFKISWESAEPEPFAICCRKEDSALRDQIDKVIDDMYKDGTMKKISETWFGEDITKGLR